VIPIRELLARIRWDAAFGRGQFTLGYVDHESEELRYVAFKDARPNPNNASMLDFVDERGEVVSLPLHRIHQVLSNGETIWQRDTPPHRHASSSKTQR
jgi:uncharacterized protein (UPF0248 family)